MLGTTISHYRIVSELGRGGMAVVYRSYDERLQRDVAIKVLPPGTATDEDARKRFRKESLALSKLNHPNIATVHDFDCVDGTDFLVMELIPGVTLDQQELLSALAAFDLERDPRTPTYRLHLWRRRCGTDDDGPVPPQKPDRNHGRRSVRGHICQPSKGSFVQQPQHVRIGK